FPTSGIVPSAAYNRGVCLQATDRPVPAIDAYRLAAQRATDPNLAHDAWFRMAVVGQTAQQPNVVLEATGAVLAEPRLAIEDRVEALARRAAALLARGERPGAVQTAEQAIALVPTPEAVSALGDDTYIAQAKFIPGEASRLDAADIAIDVSDPHME